MKRHRLRCSVRTLIVGVSLVCLYFVSWNLTQRFGAASIWRKIRVKEQSRLPVEIDANGTRWYTAATSTSSSPMAFIVKLDLFLAGHVESRYYFWFFGYHQHLAKYDQTWDVGSSVSFGVPAEQDFDWQSYWQRLDK